MFNGRFFSTAILVVALQGFAVWSMAAMTIEPAAPTALDTIRLKVEFGDISRHNGPPEWNGFSSERTRVSMAGNRITVALELMQLDFAVRVPSPRLTMPLGQFPAGTYEVVVTRHLPDGTDVGPLGSASFVVAPRAAGMPLWNHTDLWWNPDESGWGISIVQHGSGKVFATWFAYGEDGKPVWYVIPDGRWISRGEYRGIVYRTSGPWWGTCAEPTQCRFDAASVVRTPVGNATLGFVDNDDDLGAVILDIEGRRFFKEIRRQSF